MRGTGRFVSIVLILLSVLLGVLLGSKMQLFSSHIQFVKLKEATLAQENKPLLSANQQISVIIELREKANLRDIGIAKQSNRAESVVKRLQTTAEQSQLRIQTVLNQRLREGKVTAFDSFWIFNGFAVTATADVIAELATFPEVKSIVPNAEIQAPTLPFSTTIPEANITLINAPALWNLGYRGKGIVIASMDTGVDFTHPDLTTRWRGGDNSWFDPYHEHDFPADMAAASSGHGTWTMGIMVGGSEGGTGIGVAPEAQWIAAKIFNDQGKGTTANIHAAYQWVLDPDGNPETDDAPQIVNSSWSTQAVGCSLTFQADIQALRAAGILPIFAAGNAGPNSATSLSPANNPGALAVGAVDNLSQIYRDSSRGPAICGAAQTTFPALVAPGVEVRSSHPGGLYTTATGTSMAAPHVSGALALLLQAFPRLSVEEQEMGLLQGAVDLGEAGVDNTFGKGRLNVLNSYQWIAEHLENQPPLVDAGEAITLSMPNQAALEGIVLDDGLPISASVATTWSLLSGSGIVTFSDSSSLTSTADFAITGTYQLQLTAFDGELSASDELTITVNDVPINQPPKVDSGMDQTITLPASALLMGSVIDDGLPTPTQLTTTWSLLESDRLDDNGIITFSNSSTLTTTASFSISGNYILQLTAFDGELTTSDAITVTVISNRLLYLPLIESNLQK